jgi:hypothetical protein
MKFSLLEIRQINWNSSRRLTEGNQDWISNLIDLPADKSDSSENPREDNNVNKNAREPRRFELNPEFIYPWMTIEKAEDLGKIKYFRIEITKSQNTTDNDLVCKSPEEIEEKTSNLFFHLKLIDNMLKFHSNQSLE